MSIYLQVDEDQTQFASNQGWSDVCRWVDALEGDYPALKHLREHGYCEGAEQVESELQAAIDDEPPDESTVETTAQSLLAGLSGKGASLVMVTDGMGPA